MAESKRRKGARAESGELPPARGRAAQGAPATASSRGGDDPAPRAGAIRSEEGLASEAVPKKVKPGDYRAGPRPGGLSEQRHRFVAELTSGKTATDAAIAAGYSAKNAATIAGRLIREPEVAEAIEKRRAKVLGKLEVTAEKVLGELATVAFAEDVSPVKVRALELLGKHLQLFVERVDLKVDAMTPEERAARAAALLATARQRLLGSGGGDDGDAD